MYKSRQYQISRSWIVYYFNILTSDIPYCFGLYLGSLMSCRKVFVLQMSLRIPSFIWNMSQPSSIFVNREINQNCLLFMSTKSASFYILHSFSILDHKIKSKGKLILPAGAHFRSQHRGFKQRNISKLLLVFFWPHPLLGTNYLVNGITKHTWLEVEPHTMSKFQLNNCQKE